MFAFLYGYWGQTQCSLHMGENVSGLLTGFSSWTRDRGYVVATSAGFQDGIAGATISPGTRDS